MPLARRLSLLAVLALAAAFPASASAKLEFNLPSQIFKVFDESGKSDRDPGRCDAIVFLEFPKIKHAVSYRIVVKRTDLNQIDDYVAPPFDTFGRGFITRYPAPDGFARFFLGAYSTPDGCPAADVKTDVSKIVESKVSLDKPFEKRFKKVFKPPWKCALEPGERRVKIRGPFADPRWVIVRRMGAVTTTDKGSVQPINVMTNRYASPGTIVKTGHNSVVAIGAIDGSSVLVGPDMTVRLTRTGFDVLEAPRDPRVRIKVKPHEYKVRTDCAVLSARG